MHIIRTDANAIKSYTESAVTIPANYQRIIFVNYFRLS